MGFALVVKPCTEPGHEHAPGCEHEHDAVHVYCWTCGREVFIDDIIAAAGVH